MEKTDNFSFYDLLTFVIPGFILVMYSYILFRALEWEVQPLASFVPENALLSAIAIFTGSFISGFLIHYVNEQRILGIDMVIKWQRSSYNSRNFFKKDKTVAEKINEKIKNLYDWDLVDTDLNPTSRADNVFELYYNRFFNAKKLRIFNRYQLPFFLFCNITLVLWLVIITYSTAYWFMEEATLTGSLIFIASLFLLSLLCLKVAKSHREKFINAMWLSIFDELVNPPATGSNS